MRYSGDKLKSKILSSDILNYGLYKYANSNFVFSIQPEKGVLTIGKVSLGIAVEIERFFEIELLCRKYKISKELSSQDYYNIITNK